MRAVAMSTIGVLFILAIALAEATPGSRPTTAGKAMAAGSSSASSSATSSTSGSKPCPRLVIATYNINFGLQSEADLNKVIANIRAAKADVVAIQEGNQFAYAAMRKHLAGDYPHMQFYPDQAARGSGWLSKFRLLELKVLPNQVGWFSTHMAQVELDKRRVQLVDIHLMPTVPAAGDGLMDILKLYTRTDAIRMQEIERICKSLPPALPVVMLGDFNAFPGTGPIRFVTGRGFVDSLAATGPQAASQPTWADPGGRLTQRLDYVFHSPQFRTAACRVLKEGPSDHYLVVSELDLLPPQATSQPATKGS